MGELTFGNGQTMEDYYPRVIEPSLPLVITLVREKCKIRAQKRPELLRLAKRRRVLDGSPSRLSSRTRTSATQANVSYCVRISSASSALSVMNSSPTEPSWNMAWSLRMVGFCQEHCSLARKNQKLAFKFDELDFNALMNWHWNSLTTPIFCFESFPCCAILLIYYGYRWLPRRNFGAKRLCSLVNLSRCNGF